MVERVAGTVKWYNPEKAYGFITLEDGRDLFVHRNAIADGRPWLVDGQGVEFTMRQGAKGLEAEDVRVTRDVAELPASRLRSYEVVNTRGGHGRGGDGYGLGGYRGAPRQTANGPLPSGPVVATVRRIDPAGRFLFARSEQLPEDVYVHGTHFASLEVREGDAIQVSVERSDRGLRARAIAPA
jgi:cold shock CspA family protein